MSGEPDYFQFTIQSLKLNWLKLQETTHEVFLENKS